MPDSAAPSHGISHTRRATRSNPLRVAVLIGGGGRTLINLLDHIEQTELPIAVATVLATRSDLPGVARARDRGFNPTILPLIDHHAPDSFHDVVTQLLLDADSELICLAGYLRWMRVDPPFRGRVMNIHPALLPAFGGHGMYGHHVHRAVLESGVKITGCTVHFVDEEYDRGPIVLQRACPVLENDTPETLAARVFAEECVAYPDAVRLFAEGRLTIEGRCVRVDSSGTISTG